MNHKHNVEFPQLESVRKHLEENQQFYLGLAVGLLLGYWKGRSCESRSLHVYIP